MFSGQIIALGEADVFRTLDKQDIRKLVGKHFSTPIIRCSIDYYNLKSQELW